MTDKLIGSGMTVRKVETSPLDNDEAFAELRRGMRAMFDWTAFGRDIGEWAQDIMIDQPRHGWKPREDWQWFAQAIAISHKIVTDHVGRGDASGAACEAFRLGALYTEMQMKFAHEPLWEKGRRDAEWQSRGGGHNRKATLEEKLAAYREFRAAGNNKSDATYLASEKLRVSESNIRAARKSAGASD